VLTVLVVVTLLTLNINGVFDTGTALRLFFAIELPLLHVFVAITIARFRNSDRSSTAISMGFLERLEAEEPFLRPAIMELRAFKSLFLAFRRKRHIPEGAASFGYTIATFSNMTPSARMKFWQSSSAS
jgi:hypothetical protein